MKKVNYGLAIAREQMELTGTWLLIRLGLKKVTVEERYELKMRQEYIRKAAEGFRK